MAGTERPLAARTRIQQETAKEIVRLLRLAQSRIRQILAGQPTDYQRWALPQLQREIAAKIAEFERPASAAMVSGAQRSWDAGQALVDSAVARAGGDVLVAQLPGISTRQLRAMQTFMTGRIRDISVTIANRINTELGLVLIGAQSPGDAINALTRIFGGQRERAITIVRTELGRAFSAAAQERMLAAKAQVPGLKKQWRHSDKVHPRPMHLAIDGQIREIDEPYTLGNGVAIMYPRDPSAPAAETINCGCESLPYMERWEMANPTTRPVSAELARALKSRGRIPR